MVGGVFCKVRSIGRFFTHAVDGGGDDEDDDALELRSVSSSVSVRAIEVVPLVHRGVPLFDSPWLTGSCSPCPPHDMACIVSRSWLVLATFCCSCM